MILLNVIVLQSARGCSFKNPAPVDDSLADLGKRLRLVLTHGARGIAALEILDVKLQEATGKAVEITHGILAGAHAPKAVELETRELRIRAPNEFIVFDHATHAGVIEIMTMVEEMAAGFVHGLTHVVEPIGVALDGVQRFAV